jgi:hypothetical protein
MPETAREKDDRIVWTAASSRSLKDAGSFEVVDALLKACPLNLIKV